MANERHENLGPAERIINTLLPHVDHMVHNRPGMVTPDATSTVGVKWEPVTTVKEADGKTYVYKLIKKGPRVQMEVGGKKIWVRGTKVGQLWQDNTVRNDRTKVGDYRAPGVFPEVALWVYRQIAEIWRLDNEFAAKWASYAFTKDHKDLKVALAAFALVQSRKGDPIVEGGQVLFHDEDYRDVGEAMCLITKGKYMQARQLLRIHDLLTLPGIAEINRELGFGRSARTPFLGRWPKTVEKWLEYRENNPQMLDGLVKTGSTSAVKRLARLVHYKPTSPTFFKALKWRQAQASDGRRALVIGQEWDKAESWVELSEGEICQRIVAEKPSWKVIVSRLPVQVGVTRAVMAAAVESGCLSDKELIIATPTLENLGLLQVQEVREKWDAACRKAEDQRAANIAKNVKNKETREALHDAADTAVKAAVEDVAKNFRVYLMVDTSSSMDKAIDRAISYLEKFVQAFDLDKIHVCTFNTSPREITIRHASRAGVQQAFRGIAASGGTDYGSTAQFCAQHPPKDDEEVLYIYVGDEDARPVNYWGGKPPAFTDRVRALGLRPQAFGLIYIQPGMWNGHAMEPGLVVRKTAAELAIPCFLIEENTFEDVYAIPRTIQNLIAATPVGQVPQAAAPRVQRKTLVDEILETELLQKPAWAA